MEVREAWGTVCILLCKSLSGDSFMSSVHVRRKPVPSSALPILTAPVSSALIPMDVTLWEQEKREDLITQNQQHFDQSLLCAEAVSAAVGTSVGAPGYLQGAHVVAPMSKCSSSCPRMPLLCLKHGLISNLLSYPSALWSWCHHISITTVTQRG